MNKYVQIRTLRMYAWPKTGTKNPL
jgi:hypothetical protein